MSFNILSTVKGKLVTGLATLSILVIFSGVLSSYFISSLEVQLNQLTDEVGPIIESSDDLIANLWESAKVSNEILASEKLDEVSVLLAEVNDLSERFEADLKELKRVVTDVDHIKLINQASEEQKEFLKHTIEMTAQHKAELEEEIKAEELLNEFDEIGGQLITMLDEFASENEEEMRKAEDEGDVLAAKSSSTAGQVNNILGELFENDYPVVAASLKLQRIVIEMQDTSGEYLAEEQPENLPAIKAEFDKLSNSANAYFDVLSDLAETEEDKSDAVELIKLFKFWVSNAQADEKLFDSYRDQLDAEYQADQLTELLESDVDNADEFLEQVAGAADEFSQGVDEQAATLVSIATTTIFTLIAITIVISVLIIMVTFKTILAPINSLVMTLVEARKNNDLTKRINHSSNDELGQLANAYNALMDNVHGFVEKINRSAGAITDASNGMHTIIEATHQGIQNQSAETDMVAAAVNELTTSSQEVGSNMQSALMATTEANDGGKQAKLTVDSSKASIQKLASDIDGSSLIIDQLNTDANAIGSVLDVIRNIADQTNLLALNAAIEAARAGEQGRGFAVVADEVRALAAKTQNSTQEIQQMIETLQKGSTKSVEAMANSKVNSNYSVQQATVAGEFIDSIVGSIDQVNGMVEQVSDAVTQQSIVTEDINRNLSNIVTISQDTSVAMEQTSEHSKELNTLGSELITLVGEFKI